MLYFILFFSCSETIKSSSESNTETETETKTKTSIVLDVQQIDLELNIVENSAVAKMTIITTESQIKLHAKRIMIQSVKKENLDLSFEQEDGYLMISLPESNGSNWNELEIIYTFPDRTLYQFDGWMPEQGVSFIWPNHCGNLYPCNPDTQDGVAFSIDIVGVSETLTVVTPTETIPEAPPYMLGFAIGDYQKMHVGTSEGGVDLYAWYFDGDDGLEDATYGVWHMVESVNFLEQTYGPYAFGNSMGTVEVDWGSDSYGGMEHHPYFHVGQYDFWNEEAQIHEVVHGWFGNAVRLQCWEDFVLSEGTVTYMTARTLEQVAGYDLWDYYMEYFLEPICEGYDYNAIVMPNGCNEIDFENSHLWSLAPYMKGACFYEEVGDILGPDVLDQIISDFYIMHMYQAATMEEMIEFIYQHSSSEQQSLIETSVQDWLLELECPNDYRNRCLYRNP